MQTRKLFAVLALAGATLAIAPKALAQSDDDKKFLAQASQGNVDEIKLGQLAQEKASNPAVKAFGARMVKDHTMLSNEMKPFNEAWNVPPPTNLSPDAQKLYDKLNGLSGKDFDKEYIDSMVSDHSKDLSEFTSEAKDTKDAKFRTAVLKGKTVVAAHKNMAYDLKKKL